MQQRTSPMINPMISARKMWLMAFAFAALMIALPTAAKADDNAGLADGTIPIALHAGDDVDMAGASSSVRSLGLAEHVTRDGELDEALLEDRVSPADQQLSCLAAEVETPGTFMLGATQVAITGICRGSDGVWTIYGKQRISGDRYLLSGKLSPAEDGTIAFAGTAFLQMTGSLTGQSLGSFRLQN